MSAHVILNLLYELRKPRKPRILSFFRNEFDKFNNTRARMLDSVRFYLSYDIKITLKSHFFEISNQLELFPYSPILFKPFWFGRCHIFV